MFGDPRTILTLSPEKREAWIREKVLNWVHTRSKADFDTIETIRPDVVDAFVEGFEPELQFDVREAVFNLGAEVTQRGLGLL